jgi:hypothetical protein
MSAGGKAGTCPAQSEIEPAVCFALPDAKLKPAVILDAGFASEKNLATSFLHQDLPHTSGQVFSLDSWVHFSSFS